MKYRTICVDPPWPYNRQWNGFRWREGQPSGVASGLAYSSMSLPDITALPVATLAEPDAHLYLWTTQRYLLDAYEIAATWGFKPSCVLVWCKQPTGFNVGGTYMSTTEFVLFCRRGSLKALRRIDRQWFEWPRGRHSAKPEAFIDLVEQVSPGPYLEMFARRERFLWDYWGNECRRDVDMEPAS